MVKLKDLIPESSDREIVKVARGMSGLISPKGEVFYVPAVEHVDFFTSKVAKFRDFEKRFDTADSDNWSVLYKILYDEVYRDGWIRISGSKGVIGFTGSKKSLRRHKSLIDDIVMFVEAQKKMPIQVYKKEM